MYHDICSCIQCSYQYLQEVVTATVVLFIFISLILSGYKKIVHSVIIILFSLPYSEFLVQIDHILTTTQTDFELSGKSVVNTTDR